MSSSFPDEDELQKSHFVVKRTIFYAVLKEHEAHQATASATVAVASVPAGHRIRSPPGPLPSDYMADDDTYLACNL